MPSGRWLRYSSTHGKDLSHYRLLEIFCCCTRVLLLGRLFPRFSFSSSALCIHSSFLGLWSLEFYSSGVLLVLSFLTSWCYSTTRDGVAGGVSLNQQLLSSTAFPFGFHLMNQLCKDGFLFLRLEASFFFKSSSSPISKDLRPFALGNISSNHFGKWWGWMVRIFLQGYLCSCLVFPKKSASVGRLHYPCWCLSKLVACHIARCTRLEGEERHSVILTVF